ncbi:MAG: NYN domain-containing protein [Clostridia bacterium]|nr:NYN domain-containing protein [Clostridia bacterium]
MNTLNSLEQLADFLDDTSMEMSPEEIAESDKMMLSNDSFNIVSLVAYLIGVKEEILERDYLKTAYEELEKNKAAKIVRCLSIIRTSIMLNYSRINEKMTYDITNIDKMPEFIDPDIFRFLRKNDIELIKTNVKPSYYFPVINKLISDRINDCKKMFPLWVEWDYIRNLFIMPDGNNLEKALNVSKEFSANRNSYPFHKYINWPMDMKAQMQAALAHDEETDISPEDFTVGNILLNDKKFLLMLYAVNYDTFHELRNVHGAKQETKADINDFIADHDRIAIIVDCENSDPYKLTAVLRNIKEYCQRSNNPENDFGKLSKIILFDDVHTVNTWRILESYINVPVEYELIERVNDFKSLVDIRMTAGACREFYTNDIDAFLLVSSDSDFWGLISGLPDADFLVVTEYSKLGTSLVDAMQEHRISYCIMDDFAGNVADLKIGALKMLIEDYVDQRISINVNSMLNEIYEQSRIGLSPAEKQNFYNSYVKKMRLEIKPDGELRIKLGD